jgi:hypothetical protein
MMVMRPNAVGWILSVFFLVGGAEFAAFPATRLLGSIWVAVSLFLIVFYRRMIRRAKAMERLWKEGISGQATVTGITDTGMTVNDQPVVKLGLKIEAEGLAPYELEKRMTVPRVAVGTLTQGAAIPVRIDRKNHSNIAIGWAVGGTAAAGAQPVMDLRGNLAIREAVLKALREQGIDIAHQVAAADPSTPVQPALAAPAPGDTLARLQKLQEIKDAGLVTMEEFLEQRTRILTDI